jgi:[NiFe] hydrogenase diaphorase moiety small subunit
MSEFTFTIDNVPVKARKGQTILEAADAAGIYIPRLCYHKDLLPGGACRLCTVLVNGRPQSACTHPAADGMTVQNETPELADWRRSVLEMIFVEGNHYCMFCEKSGNCELQALGYRLGMLSPRHPFLFPLRNIDMSHPDVAIDRNRCILCGRCVRGSKLLDKKSAFGMVRRGAHTRLAVNSGGKLKDTDLSLADRAVNLCPVGCILRKREGYKIPIGRRLYDAAPIGSEVEKRRS